MAGRIIAGKPVRLACERHLRDLKERKETGMKWKPKVAQLAILFFAEMLTVEVRGEVKPFALEPFQKFIVGSLFGWHNGDDNRRFRTAYVEIGKGNGKTPLAAGIGLYGLIADGEASPEVYAAATTTEQARIAFKDAVAMVSRSEELRGVVEERVGSLYYGARNGVFRPVSSEHRGLDGKRVHMALVDELHEHPNAMVVDKMRAGTKARRQALIFEITNSGSDLETVCWNHHDKSLGVLERVVDDPAWFAFVCQIDDGDDWLDEKVWPKANPGLGTILPIQYLREQVREARTMPSKQNIVKRLNFCIWTQQVTVWIPLEEWDPCCGELETAGLLGLPAYGGLDLSTKLDLTSFVVTVRREDNPDLPTIVVEVSPAAEAERGQTQPIRRLNLNFCVDVHPFFWIPEDTMHQREKEDRVPYSLWREMGILRVTPGDVVDYDAIYHQIVNEIAPRFNLRQIGYDPYNATQFALNLQAANFEMVEVRQGMQSLSEPSKVFEALVKSKRLRHDGHAVLRWNVSNVAVKNDENGNIRPVKPKMQRKRIDGVLASVIALSRLIVAPVESGSVYDKPGRGVLVY